jgi:glutamate synthase (NADPH/NADH) large chain
LIPEDHSIVGNVSLYGATSGEAYINGKGGARFAVRNSGANVVVEGVGDHGCEYMTGGTVVILGETGRNFAAGMSGGIAYLHVTDVEKFESNCNKEMVLIEKLKSEIETAEVKAMIVNHYHYTGSPLAKRLLHDWKIEKHAFIRIIPKEYKQMMEAIDKYKKNGLTLEDAKLAAYKDNLRPAATNPVAKLDVVQNC